MLIQGKKINPDNLDDVIAALATLPTGFSNRNVNFTTISYKSQKAVKTNQAGGAAHGDWVKNKQPAFLEEAANYFQRAAEIAASADDQPARAENLNNFAHMLLSLGRPHEAIPAFEKAVSIYEKENHLDYLYYALGSLHKAVLDCASQKVNAGEQAEADILISRLQPLRQRSSEIFSIYKGTAYDNEAYRVEQGEIGFSADKKIGTDNINACVCVIIRDPVTKKTALVHVDSATNIGSLQQAFKRLPTRNPPDLPLEAKLIGGRFGPDSGDENGKTISRSNIDKISKLLDKHHVEIVSAAILDPDQPTSAVVDPITFEIEERPPGIHNPYKDAANVRPIVEAWVKPLQVAFDLTVSEQRAAILLSKDAVANLRHSFAGKTEWELYEVFNRRFQYSDTQLPVAIEQTISLVDAYQQSADALLEKLDEKIASLKTENIDVPHYERDKAAKALAECPIHIGEGAKQANSKLTDYIRDELFAMNGKTLTTNIEGLQNFAFPEQPYEVIEAAQKGSSFQAKHATSRNAQTKGVENARF